MTGTKARALGVAVGVVALQALLVPLFSAPAAKIAPRDLPIVVAGPAPAADTVAAQLDAAVPGGFDITRVPDAAAADTRIRDRQAYAALVVGQAGLGLHVASAASPTVANLLTQASGQLAQGRPIPVVDVVPAPADDPHGAGFGSGFLPLVLTSSVAGALIALLVGSRAGRVLGVLTFGVLAGLAGGLVLHGWLGVVGGEYVAVAGAVGLIALAASAAVAGLGSLLGRAGAVLGVALVFLVGNALSGVNSAPELLPKPWGEVGQWLPPGAGGTLLRSVSAFSGHGATHASAVLAGWVVAGLLLAAIGPAGLRRPDRAVTVPARVSASDVSAVPATIPE